MFMASPSKSSFIIYHWIPGMLFQAPLTIARNMHILGVKNTAIKIGIRYLSETTEELVFFLKKKANFGKALQL